jgi:anti-sigma-K factor RskA
MTDRRDEFMDLCAAHALGALDEADRARFDRLLREGGEEHARMLAELTDAASALALAAPPIVPPPGLKRRVLEAVAAEAPPARALVPLRRRAPLGLAIAGWALAAMFAGLFIVRGRVVEDLRVSQALLEQERGDLARALDEEQAWARAMASPSSRVAFLAATGATEPSGWAVYDPGSRRAIVVLEHLPPSAGEDYELWAIEAGTPRSLGVVPVDAAGRAVVRLDHASDPAAGLAAFAVSREAKGGSPNPNVPAGPVILVGALGT